MFVRTFVVILLVVFVLSFKTALAYEPPAVAAPRPLEYPADTYAFKNETVWNYVDGSPQPEVTGRPREYTQRCFVMSRSIVQFWKFARFDPALPPLPRTTWPAGFAR